MAIQAHLVELERKHKSLENELHEALIHLSTDDLQIAEFSTEVIAGRERLSRSFRDRPNSLPVATREIAPQMSIRPRLYTPATVPT
jgi:hypothetical protein